MPAIPTKVPPKKEKLWWILIAENDTLEAAYDYLRTYPAHAPPARLIPYWTSQSGTRFALVLKEYFYDEEAAHQYLRNMPPDLSSRAAVSVAWDEDTVYFADPLLGR